ncbi:MAG: hypothetical protein R3F34_13285 [Planctomycetota bacterium]
MSPSFQTRAWIVCLAGVCFLAGFASGVLRERRGFDRVARAEGAFAAYRERLVRDFDLSPERERWLGMLLESYQQQLEQLESRGLAGMQDEVVELGDRYNDWIRERVIPASQRQRFDLMLGAAAGGDGASAAL